MSAQFTVRRQLMAVAAILGLLIVVAAAVTTSTINRDRYAEQRALRQPRLVSTQPAAGGELTLDGAIRLVFDQPMNHFSVEHSITLDPPVPFAIHWDDDLSVAIQPQPGVLRPASRIVLTITEAAASKSGWPLLEPRAIRMDTVGFLRVNDLSPAGDTKNAPQNQAIRIMFNHPVVSLTLADNQGALTTPLNIDPPTEGQGRWVNTSIYEWHPTSSLHSGQKYTVTVDRALTDTAGARLDKSYSTTFSVTGPKIESVTPDSSERRDSYYSSGSGAFPLDTPIDITFNMPMDRARTEQAVSLVTSPDNLPVAGQFSWNDDSTHLTFKPASLLDLDGEYKILVADGARSADGFGKLEKLRRTTTFDTVSKPVASLAYERGSSDYSPFFQEQIAYNTLMDEDTLLEPGRVTISPEPLSAITVTSSSYGYSGISINARLSGDTNYTLTVNAGAKDVYGNAVEKPLVHNFRTRGYYPRVQINTGDRFSMIDASQPAQIILASVAVKKVDFSLYKITTDQFKQVRQRYSDWTPPSESLVRGWSETIVGVDDQSTITPVNLAADGGPLAPGIYWLKTHYDYSRNSYSPDQILFVVNATMTLKNSSGQSMVWLTDIHTAQPLGGVPVSIYALEGSNDSSTFEDHPAVTASDGTAYVTIKPSERQDPYYDSYYGPNVYALVDDGSTFAVALSSWSEGISAADFGIGSAYIHSAQTLYIYTDRPIYRPGQEVYFKGILRNRDDMVFSLPGPGHVEVKLHAVTNDYGETRQVDQKTITVDETGSFSGSFELGDDAKLGAYHLVVDTGEPRFERQECAYYYYCGDRSDLTFQVADYRKPEFDVRLTPDAPDILAGTATSVTLNADFFAGGPVSNAKVKWVVKDYSAAFSYDGPGRYRFADYEQYWGYFYYDYGFGGYDDELDIYDTLAEGEGTTDASGRLVIPFTTQKRSDSTREIVIEAEVSDIGGLAVSGKTRVVSHSAQYHVGIASDSYWGSVGDTQTMRLIVVDWAGKPVTGQTVILQVSKQTYRRERKYNEYGSVYWDWTTVDVPVGDPITVTTNDKGEAEVPIVLAASGSFRVRARVTDPAGGTHSSSAFVWASNYSYTLLRDSQTDDQTDMIPDRASYQPGDTASILINNPFQGDVNALITIERENVLSHQVVTLPSGATSYQVPITADMAPDVYVSATLLKGIDETSPTIDFKMALTKLKVLPTAQTLKVAITTSAEVLTPGQTADFHVQVTDLAGNPVQAQVSLALVDASVLKLAKPNSVNILDHFYGDRLLGVRTSQPLTALVNRLFVEIIPADEAGGMGGGGGGPGLRQPDSIRDDFKDTGYWNATLNTDAQGGADVSVPLPDNLTVWHLDARAVTADTHVGQGEAEIQATLPLLIRPETPRFFITGDRATLSAIVNNNTGGAIDTTVMLESQGLTLEGPARQQVTIPAHDRQIIQWPVQVNPGAEWVDVVFSAEGGGYSDAARPEIGDADHNRMLPVFRYTVYESVATAGQLSYSGERTEYVSLPPGLDPTNGGLTVNIQHSLAASALDGLTWLKHYPYECNEQFTSRLLPNSITLAALRDLGVDQPVLEQQLTEERDYGVKTLMERQKPNGSWGLWPEDDGNDLVTTYVVYGLLEARKAGADVDQTGLKKAIRYLETSLLASPDKSKGGWNRRAYVAYVLSRAPSSKSLEHDEADNLPEFKSLDTLITTLYDRRDDLNLYGKALLAQAMWNRRPSDLRLLTLRGELTDAAIVNTTTAHWEETSPDYWNWGTDTRTTAVVLDTFIKVWPDSDLGPGATRWLISVRKVDHWATTQETAWSLLALTDWLRVTRELEGDYPWKLTLGGTELASGKASPATLLETTTVDIDLQKFLATDNFTIARGDGPGRLYYTGQLVTYPAVESATAVNNGVSISHRYLDADGNPVSQARVGDTLTVEVTVVAPSTLYYPILEDYYPAGADPIDPDLLSQPLSNKKASLESQDENNWRWGWSWFSHVEMRDEKAVWSTDYLPSGTYQLRYQVRIATPGVFHVIPPTVWQFYLPDVYGRGSGSLFQVLPAE